MKNPVPKTVQIAEALEECGGPTAWDQLADDYEDKVYSIKSYASKKIPTSSSGATFSLKF